MPLLYFFASLVLMYTAPSQVHAADTGKSWVSLVYEFGSGKFGGCPLVASCALPCASCPCAPDTSYPCLGNGDLASVLLVPFVAPGAAPSLRAWCLRTMYFVKFDWVVLFKLKGWAAATLPRAASLAATWLGIPARSNTCPPRSQTPLPLALMAACWAAPLQPARVLSLDLQLGAAERGFVNFAFLACWWPLLHACVLDLQLGAAGGCLVCWSTFPRKFSGKGRRKGERKAGSLDLSLELWTIRVPYQVTSPMWAAAFSEAAFVGCFALLQGQLQPEAAYFLLTRVLFVFSSAAARDLHDTLVGDFSLLVGASSVCLFGFVLFGILEGLFHKYPDDGAKGSMGITTRQHASPGETDRSPGQALPAAAAHLPVEQVLGFKRPGNEQSSASKFTRLFIRDLKGKTFLFQWDMGWDLEHAYLAVAQRVGVPHGLFYMTWNGTMLTPRILLSLSVDDVVVMHGRIRGGGSDTSDSGEWYCSRCRRWGCWVTKPTCFRCGLHRMDSEVAQNGSQPLTLQLYSSWWICYRRLVCLSR